MTTAANRDLQKAKKKTPAGKKKYESAVPLLLMQIKAMKLPEATIEVKFHPSRGWKFDVAFMSAQVAVEVDGGAYIHGRHARGQGIEEDNEKLAEAALRGWMTSRATPRQVKNGKAITWLVRHFERIAKEPHVHQ